MIGGSGGVADDEAAEVVPQFPEGGPFRTRLTAPSFCSTDDIIGRENPRKGELTIHGGTRRRDAGLAAPSAEETEVALVAAPRVRRPGRLEIGLGALERGVETRVFRGRATRFGIAH